MVGDAAAGKQKSGRGNPIRLVGDRGLEPLTSALALQVRTCIQVIIATVSVQVGRFAVTCISDFDGQLSTPRQFRIRKQRLYLACAH